MGLGLVIELAALVAANGSSSESNQDTRRRLIGGAVTVAGLGQLALSYAWSGWASGVLVNTGTATLLFVPLYVVQQSMDLRVRETRESVASLEREVRDTQDEL